jgi:hypothetical protein
MCNTYLLWRRLRIIPSLLRRSTIPRLRRTVLLGPTVARLRGAVGLLLVLICHFDGVGGFGLWLCLVGLGYEEDVVEERTGKVEGKIEG